MPMWAQSVQSGAIPFSISIPTSYFLFTEKLGILAVFFATSKSPKLQNKIFFLREREGSSCFTSSIGPGRQWPSLEAAASPWSFWSLLSPGPGKAPRTLGIW